MPLAESNLINREFPSDSEVKLTVHLLIPLQPRKLLLLTAFALCLYRPTYSSFRNIAILLLTPELCLAFSPPQKERGMAILFHKVLHATWPTGSCRNVNLLDEIREITFA